MWIPTNCGKILKRWEYQTTLPIFWESCIMGQEPTEPDMEQRTGSKLGKEYDKAVYCHRAYLTSMQNTSCKMPGWMRITSCNQDCWENTNNFRYAEWKSWLETQHSKNKEHGILSHHFMANRRRKIGSSDRFHFLAPKSLWTVSNCNREIKRHLLLGRKVMTNLDNVFKSRGITLLQKSI